MTVLEAWNQEAFMVRNFAGVTTFRVVGVVEIEGARYTVIAVPGEDAPRLCPTGGPRATPA